MPVVLERSLREASRPGRGGGHEAVVRGNKVAAARSGGGQWLGQGGTVEASLWVWLGNVELVRWGTAGWTRQPEGCHGRGSPAGVPGQRCNLCARKVILE
jgi:hypothetical protein